MSRGSKTTHVKLRRPPARGTRRRLRSGKTRLFNTVLPILVLGAVLAMGFAFVNKQFAGEERAAVEEAALQAAADLSKIVINTPECGFISLSDFPPDGSATVAKDGFSLPVRSINTIIGTVRLDLIIADKLQQSLIEEFAEQDLRDGLAAKDKLVSTLKTSLLPGAAAKDKDGNSIMPYASAEEAYNKKKQNEPSGSSKYKKGTLKLSLGSYEGGSATAVPVPEPQSTAPVSEEKRDGDFYRSYVNVPYKDIDFVFGGIGKSVKILDAKNWKERLDGLPYQIPTIVKVEIAAADKPDGEEVACAQTCTFYEPAAPAGALSLSFPDGPVPEIKHPGDCCLNSMLNKFNSSTQILSAKGGDYPVDSGSFLQSMDWPLTNSQSIEPTANIWRLALHDWIRSAGVKANIDSVVNMQKVELDECRPAKIMWTAPLQPGGPSTNLAPIANGIIHIFEFDKDGVVLYRSKAMTPYPLDVCGQGQMCAISKGALDGSDVGEQTINVPHLQSFRKVIFKATWDVYIRDQVRRVGTIYGGKHGGGPMAKPILSSNILIIPVVDDAAVPAEAGNVQSGNANPPQTAAIETKGNEEKLVQGKEDVGYPPLITPQSDFAEAMVPQPPFVKPMPFGSGFRPFYASGGSSGTAVDIRFRRQIDVSDLNGFTSFGYVGTVGSEQ